MKLDVFAICFWAAAVADGATLQRRPTITEWEADNEDAADEVAASAANGAKMAAVDKVVSLLESLTHQVLSEGDVEAQGYNKFACFCKDTTNDKSAAIQRGTDEKARLSTWVETLEGDRDTCDENIAALQVSIKQAEDNMKMLTGTRKKDLAAYERDAADLTAAIDALRGAIKTLKASEKPSFAQLKSVSGTLRRAVAMAEALGMGGASLKSLLVAGSAPDVPMEDYKFHSTGIIETLEELMEDFRAEKMEVDVEEVHSVATFKGAMQTEEHILKTKNQEMDVEQKTKARVHEEIASNNQQLSTVAATLLDDQEYLKDLSQMCSDKAKTWDQRSQVRQDELSALASATAIIKSAVGGSTTAATLRLAQRGVAVHMAEAVARSPEAMEAVEAAAERVDAAAASDVRAPVAFLQRRLSHQASTSHSAPADDGRQVVLDLLRGSAARIHSSLLTSLASRIAADPFAKVKVLIQELIERLLKQASNEANQKGWCDKSTADAEQKRDYAAGQVEELNGEMAQFEALRDKLIEEMSTLSADIDALEKKRSEAEVMRSQESADNANTVREAQEGLAALEQAMDILTQFYGTVAKETLEPSLLQGPANDAPDAGFKNFEAYQGAQGEAGGIVGMLKVIKSDFARTITETDTAENQAEQDHLEFMTATGKSLAEKNVAHGQKTSQKDDTLRKLEEAGEGLESQMTIVVGNVKELMELKSACIDTGMSYKDRVARREDEIAALKKAGCILQHYAEYGPEGAADGC